MAKVIKKAVEVDTLEYGHNDPGCEFKQPMVWNEDRSALVPNGDPINIQEQIDAAAVGTRPYEIIDRVLRGVADLDTSIDWQDADVSGMPEYLADAKEIAMRRPSDAAIKAAEAEIQAKQEAQQQALAEQKQKDDDEKLNQRILELLSKMKENQ